MVGSGSGGLEDRSKKSKTKKQKFKEVSLFSLVAPRGLIRYPKSLLWGCKTWDLIQTSIIKHGQSQCLE